MAFQDVPCEKRWAISGRQHTTILIRCHSDRQYCPPPSAISDGLFAGHFSSARFTGALNRHDDGNRYELRGGAGRVNRRLEFGDNQFDADRLPVSLQSTNSRSNDISWNASAKLIHSFSETHKFTVGAEIEGVRRIDHTVTFLNGAPQLAAFGSELDISTRRQAL